MGTQAGTSAEDGSGTARTDSATTVGERAATEVETEAGEAEGSHVGPTLLIVEDQPHLLRLLVRVFTRAGFRVLSASDGQLALDVFERHKDDMAAAFVDVGIPPYGVPQVLDGMLALRRDLGIVLMSGDNLDADLRERLAGCGGRFIRKPFAAEAAVRVVREVLGEAAG